MIDTQAIRTKILDLAMRGKLTEQLPEDGTAEDLFQQIQEEKQALIRAGKIKKEKPLPDITEDEIPFEIPSNWKWERIGAVLTLQSGKNITACEIKGFPDEEHKIPCYGGNGQRGFVCQSNVDGFHAIIGRQGALCGNINFAEGSFYATEHAVVVYEYADCDMLWIGMTLRFLNLNQYATSVAQPGLAVNKIDKVLMPLPPLAEQKRIVEKIEQIFSILDAIDALQAKYAGNLTALKAKLIDAAIQGKLTEQLPEDGTAEEHYIRVKESKDKTLRERRGRADKNIKEVDQYVPYSIPSNWKWIRLGEIGLFKKGPFGSALTKSMFVPKGVDTIKVYEQQHAIKKNADLGSYYITRTYFDDKMSGFEVKPGDILVSCAGTIGETYVMPDNIEQGIINQALMRVTLADGINKQFFQFYFDAYLKSSAKLGNGSAIINIPPFDIIKNWYFPLPPLAEQERIVNQLNELFAAMG